MKLAGTIFVSLTTLAASSVSLLQRSVSLDENTTDTTQWAWYDLDENAAAQRGSVCLDGSAPGYFYKPGTLDDKWIISFEGGRMFCASEDECHDMADGTYVGNGPIMEMTIFEDETFVDYHQIQFHHCDGGMWLSDRSEPLVHSGKNVYFRGKRILDYTIEYLIDNTPLGTATDVLITGGSGGAQVSYLVADYLASILPKSVNKIGAVPMSGWYNVDSNSAEWVYKEHGMEGAITPGCYAAFAEGERHNCLEPRHAYTYSVIPTFVSQVLDRQSLTSLYSDNTTLSDAVSDAWVNCIDEPNGNCSDVNLLNDYLDNYTTTLRSISKISKNGEGGFISTCKKHVFYKMEEYNKYEIDGVSLADAVKRWWEDLSRPAKWYWPCTLNEHGSEAQCESSCAFDSCQLPGADQDSCKD